jgi:hypothetical protein
VPKQEAVENHLSGIIITQDSSVFNSMSEALHVIQADPFRSGTQVHNQLSISLTGTILFLQAVFRFRIFLRRNFYPVFQTNANMDPAFHKNADPNKVIKFYNQLR